MQKESGYLLQQVTAKEKQEPNQSLSLWLYFIIKRRSSQGRKQAKTAEDRIKQKFGRSKKDDQ